MAEAKDEILEMLTEKVSKNLFDDKDPVQLVPLYDGMAPISNQAEPQKPHLPLNKWSPQQKGEKDSTKKKIHERLNHTFVYGDW